MPALSKASLALGSQIPRASVDTPVLSVLSGFRVCVSEYPMACAAWTKMYLLAHQSKATGSVLAARTLVLVAVL
jgi:hypothetical protein